MPFRKERKILPLDEQNTLKVSLLSLGPKLLAGFCEKEERKWWLSARMMENTAHLLLRSLPSAAGGKGNLGWCHLLGGQKCFKKLRLV